MKIVSVFMLSMASLMNNAAECITFEKDAATEHFKSIVCSFSKIAENPKNPEILEENVSKMIAGIMDLMEEARKNGINITKEECEKIFNDLDEKSRTELTKMLQEDNEITRTQTCDRDCEEVAAPTEEQETTKGCCKDKCKDKCSCSSTTTTSCCKSTEITCDENGCSVDDTHCMNDCAENCTTDCKE